MSDTACTGCGILFEIGVVVGVLCPQCNRAARRAEAEHVRRLVRDAALEHVSSVLVYGELGVALFIADRVVADLELAPSPALYLPDLVHLAELVEYVETCTGLNSTSDPQDHAGATIKPAAWVALLRRLMAGADPALVAEARERVKAEFEARKGRR